MTKPITEKTKWIIKHMKVPLYWGHYVGRYGTDKGKEFEGFIDFNPHFSTDYLHVIESKFKPLPSNFPGVIENMAKGDLLSSEVIVLDDE